MSEEFDPQNLPDELSWFPHAAGIDWFEPGRVAKGVGFFVYAVSYWLSEYARKEKVIPDMERKLGHATKLLQAEKIRNGLTEKLQRAFVEIENPDFAALRDLSLKYFLWDSRKHRYDREELETLIDEALLVAAGKTDGVVSVQERFGLNVAPVRPAGDGDVKDIYDGCVKACLDLPWALG